MLVRSGGLARSSLLACITSLLLSLSALGCGDGDATRNDPRNTSSGGRSGAGGAAGDATNGGDPAALGGEAGGGAGEARGGAGGSEVECTEDDDCVPLGECYAAACEAGSCVGSVRPRGSTCRDGFCNGFARCLACLDDAPGVERDRGCTEDSPLCAEADSAPACVACKQDADCDDDNPCSADRCTDARCEHAAFPRGTSCGAGMCNEESGSDSCVPCFEDPTLGRDPGCTSDRPRCDTSTTPARCARCALLSNGDFEAGNAEWAEMSTSYPQVIYLVDYVPTLRAHTEPYIAWLGGAKKRRSRDAWRVPARSRAAPPCG